MSHDERGEGTVSTFETKNLMVSSEVYEDTVSKSQHVGAELTTATLLRFCDRR